MLSSDPPRPDVVEVSIFGPGKGESVLVHLGDSKWIIVDSCVDQQSHNVPVLDYLQHLGVAVETDVLMVLGTHAHDDHIAGIARVFDECKSAFFACSAAPTMEDIAALIAEDIQAEISLRRSSYSEFRSVNDIADRRRKLAGGRRFLKRAVEELTLVDLDFGALGSSKVTALSPSHHAVTRGLGRIAGLAAVQGNPRRVSSADPNEFSVALWVEAMDKVALLGADLLKGPNGCGWMGILTEFKPRKRATLFKIPHHGAPNADLPEVWGQLLEPNPVALLTPYRGSQTPRPSAADRARIRTRASRSYITALPSLPTPGRSVKTQRAELGEFGRDARNPWGQVGHVRARSRAGQPGWVIELDPPARALSQVPYRSRSGRR